MNELIGKLCAKGVTTTSLIKGHNIVTTCLLIVWNDTFSTLALINANLFDNSGIA